MMRVALLVAAVCVVQARVIAFGIQDSASIQGKPSYADFSGTQPRPVSVSQSVEDDSDGAYLLLPDQMQLAWAYQQVDLLNSLQSYMLTPRTPCGHASRLREQQQQQTPHLSTSTMNPVVMSYLASSRLSSLPASFDVFAQADDDSVSDTSSFTTAADDMVNSAIMGALLGSDRTQLQDESEASQSTATSADKASIEAADEADADEVTLVARALSNVVPEHLSLMKGSMDAADWSEFDQLAEQREGTDSPLSWSLVDDEGHVNWGVLLFSLLCIACGAVWLGLLRTWCALGASCLSCPRKQRQAQFLTMSEDDMHSPLLAPLQHEGLGGPTGAMTSSVFKGAKNIEVASEHAPAGIEYVTIAYAPLKGEA
ncbi:TPA: hypothetical protein ACH3X3_006985 [Trebouxia sp. C0006]